MGAPDNTDLARSLGRVEGELTAMDGRMERLEAAVSDGFDKLGAALKAIEDRLSAIEAKESERAGAWKGIAGIASAASAIGATVAFLFDHFSK